MSNRKKIEAFLSEREYRYLQYERMSSYLENVWEVEVVVNGTWEGFSEPTADELIKEIGQYIREEEECFCPGCYCGGYDGRYCDNCGFRHDFDSESEGK